MFLAAFRNLISEVPPMPLPLPPAPAPAFASVLPPAPAPLPAPARPWLLLGAPGRSMGLAPGCSCHCPSCPHSFLMLKKTQMFSIGKGSSGGWELR